MKANSSRNGIAFDCQTWRNRKMRILASTRSTPGEGKMWPRTDLLDLFGVLHPIMQAPMSGYGGPALVATVSNAGGLGGRHSGRARNRACLWACSGWAHRCGSRDRVDCGRHGDRRHAARSCRKGDRLSRADDASYRRHNSVGATLRRGCRCGRARDCPGETWTTASHIRSRALLVGALAPLRSV